MTCLNLRTHPTWFCFVDGKKVRIPGRKLLSNRMVRCLSNVEAFSLRAADLEEFTSRFARFLRNARVQGAIRFLLFQVSTNIAFCTREIFVRGNILIVKLSKT